MKDGALLSLARQWALRPQLSRGVSPAQRQHTVPAGIPTIRTLDPFPPQIVAVIHGLALAVFVVTSFAVKYSLFHVLLQVRIPQVQFGSPPSAPAFFQPTVQPKGEAPIAGQNRATVSSVTANAKSQRPKSSSRPRRQRVIGEVIENLKKHYIDPDVAQKMAHALLAREKNGGFDTVTDDAAFADLLTRQIRDVSHDMHLVVVYSQASLPQRLTGPTPEDLARYREAMEHENCTFEKVKILPRNIGYLKLNSFPDPSVCRSTARTAMASLNHVDAIIFDLRDNRGGEPDMVALMAAYLFDHPEYWYNPRENTTQRSWTLSPVPGNRLADKPVYVLTSARTFSGAEQFCYDLKMLRRATLVGETTGGAAHSGVFHRIDDHFGMGIPETRPINPFSMTDWAETGVEPDVKVKAADALQTAEKLAEGKLPKK